MKIVCGTDFSTHAAEAANVAAALAARSDSAVTLVHAVEPAGVELTEVKSPGLERQGQEAVTHRYARFPRRHRPARAGA